MKRIYVILVILSISLSSCNWTNREDSFNEPDFSLTDLLQSYDLWYIDIDKTTGTGNISFMSKAFTMSFMPNGEVFANNNIVGLGITGNGYGIDTGFYTAYDYDGVLSITDDISGQYDFEVSYTAYNEIQLYNRAENVTYYLTGYQKSHFDFDKLFYENVTYFLQEYEAWHKVFENLAHPSEPFTAENHLSFYVEGNQNVFVSSESPLNIAVAQIYWDYTGVYEVHNTSRENEKRLVLYYDINNEQERFNLEILDDTHIRLTNTETGNIYEFYGQGYIQYRPAKRRLAQKQIKITNQHYLLK